MEQIEGMQGIDRRLGVCPRCGKTAELVVCPICNLEMVDCEQERYSDAYNDYREAKDSENEGDIGIFRWVWQDHVFNHYVCNKGSDKYYQDSFERWSFIETICPFCDSFHTRKITFSEKFADFRSNGLKGKKRKMKRHCSDCNHDY